MGHDLRTEFPERASEKDILQKDRIGARVPRLARRTEKVGKLIVLHKGIECDIYLCAQKMRFPRQLCKRRNAKIFRALARGKSRQSQIYGVRARTKRRVCRFFVPGGGQEVRSLSSYRTRDEFLRRIVPHVLEPLIARRDFNEDGKVCGRR